ncbi:MAG: carbamoyltransferase [Xanthomonadales bacterium]|jgi:carbamoyltransferase|nr:carbamoyltransferase [Xanthomonadales bacterium]
MKILGISAYYHDSAAALVEDGTIVCAAQEERFTRKKHDASFPRNAIGFCLDYAGLSMAQLDAVVFYEKPLLTFERLLETYLSFAPRGFTSFARAMPVWLKEKLYLKQILKKHLADQAGDAPPPLYFSRHHQSHAASAFYPGPFQEAAVLCMDGVGEWATTSAWLGRGKQLEPLWEVDFPHSLGLLYSAFTYFCGFRVNSGEYKLMGLAPYGKPVYADLVREKLVDIKPDGTFRLNMDYFDYCTGLRMTNKAFAALFGGPRREPETDISQREMDLAASVQQVTEDIVLRLATTLKKETGQKNLCLSGGVALNCVANGLLHRQGLFEEIWVQPAAGDAGGALGAALAYWQENNPGERFVPEGQDTMQGAYLGPAFNDGDSAADLERLGAVVQTLADDELPAHIAGLIDRGKVVGWFQGRMEFGPRALGGRSILGDPRSPEMQRTMNLKIKYRESFRPFAPSVLAEHAAEVFSGCPDSPYMLLVMPVSEGLRYPRDESRSGLEQINLSRSQLPAITHVDYSARVQTVHRETNPRYHALLEAFHELTGCPVLINTSFNVRGEPIVNTPEDAYRCFMRTEMDYLVIGNLLLDKAAQPPWSEQDDWRETFELD